MTCVLVFITGALAVRASLQICGRYFVAGALFNYGCAYAVGALSIRASLRVCGRAYIAGALSLRPCYFKFYF
jgi:hypothetical protein